MDRQSFWTPEASGSAWLVLSGVVVFVVCVLCSTGTARVALRLASLRWLRSLQKKDDQADSGRLAREAFESLDQHTSKLIYPEVLHFQNLPDVSEMCLKDYLIRLTGCKVVRMLFTEAGKEVFVSFDRNQDLATVQSQCKDPANALIGHQLSVSEVACNDILVENINPATSKEKLQLFIDHQVNLSILNGVRTVHIFADHHKAIVFLKDSEALDRIINASLKKTLVLDGHSLYISLYPLSQCLGLPAGSNFQPPPPVEIAATELRDYLILSFLSKCSSHMKLLRDSLRREHALLTFQGDGILRFTCTLSPEIPGVHNLAHTWSYRIKQIFYEFVERISVKCFSLPEEDWTQMKDVVGGLKGYRAVIITQIKFHCAQAGPEKNIYVVGEEPFSSDLLEKLKEKQYTHVRLPVLLRYFNLLTLHSFPPKETDVQIFMKEGIVSFRGTHANVNKSIAEMQRFMNGVHEETIAEFSSARLILLQRQPVASLVAAKFQQENLVAVWEADDRDVCVFAFTEADARRASYIIKDTVVECSVALSESASELLREKSWKQLKRELENKHGSVLSICPGDAGIVVLIWIVGIKHVVVEVKKQIEDFWQNTVFTSIVSFQPYQQKFISSMWMDKISHAVDGIGKEKIKISTNPTGKDFILKGTLSGLEEAKKKLRDLGKEVITEKKTLTSLVLVKYLAREDGINASKTIAKSNKCLISFYEEKPGKDLLIKKTVEDFSRVTYPIATISDTTGPQRTSLTKQFSVKIVQGYISEQQADVIVNTAQPNLDLTYGFVPSCVLAEAGILLQDECRKKYPTGLQNGGIAVTKSYGLGCREVFHIAVPAAWSSETSKSWKTAITRCLIEADRKQYVSIVFPALGAGQLCIYPRDQTAQLMLTTIDSFHRLHPSTSVRDIRIVIYHNDLFTGAAYHKALALSKFGARSDVPRKSRPTNTMVQQASIQLFFYAENAVSIKTTLRDLEERANRAFRNTNQK